jgi:hypothetical protein
MRVIFQLNWFTFLKEEQEKIKTCNYCGILCGFSWRDLNIKRERKTTHQSDGRGKLMIQTREGHKRKIQLFHKPVFESQTLSVEIFDEFCDEIFNCRDVWSFVDTPIGQIRGWTAYEVHYKVFVSFSNQINLQRLWGKVPAGSSSFKVILFQDWSIF